MKTVIVVLLIPIVIFSLDISNSFKIGMNCDLENSSVNFYTDMWLNGSFADVELSGNFSINLSRFDSFAISISKDPLEVKVYKNKVFSNSEDIMGVYSFSSGQDGFSISLWNFRTYFLTSNALIYSTVDWEGLKVLLGLRGDILDSVLSFSRNDTPLFVEAYKTFRDGTLDGIYLVGLKTSDWNYGLKYQFGSISDLPSFTRVDPSKSGHVDFWLKPGKFELWGDLNTESLMDSRLGFKYSWEKLWFEIEKGGFGDVSTDLLSMEDYGVSLGGSFEILGSNLKLSYSFGKPAHNTVKTVGEVYRAELFKSIGNSSLFLKVQYIIGYYERRFTAYGELKISDSKNSEVKLTVGNGDFENVNTFQWMINLEINTWW